MTYYLRWPTPKKFFDFDLKYCNRYMNLQEATDFQKYHFVTLVRINFGCSDFKNISLVYITKRYLSKLLLYWNKNQESKLPPSLIIPIFAPISVIALVSFFNLVEYKPIADYFLIKCFMDLIIRQNLVKIEPNSGKIIISCTIGEKGITHVISRIL